MLKQQRRVETRSNETPEDVKVRHIYAPRTPMGVGAVAYCGHVKRESWQGHFWDGRVLGEICLVCAEFAARA